METLILQFTEDESFRPYEVTIEMKELYEGIEELIRFYEREKEEGIDLNSHLYRKKVKPFIEKVGESLYGKE